MSPPSSGVLTAARAATGGHAAIDQSYRSRVALLHVHQLGTPTGPPLLAIHGITAHGRRFRRLAEEAWPERHTVAVDLRGHGRSLSDGPWNIGQHVADLVDTLDALGLATVDVVGHSYGGVIGLALLAMHPQRVARLVMLDPAFALAPDTANQRAAESIADPGYGSVQEATIGRNDGLGDAINSAVIEDVAEHLVQGEDGRFRFRFHRPAVIAGWGELCTPLPPIAQRRPALLVVAEKAGIVKPAVEQALTDRFGDQLKTVRVDCGHMLYWERFDETAAAVNDFLA
jgi:lipase